MFTNVANLGFRQGSLKGLHRSLTVYVVANSFSCRKEILNMSKISLRINFSATAASVCKTVVSLCKRL